MGNWYGMMQVQKNSMYTMFQKKETRMFLSYLLKNLADSGEILYAVVRINLLQSIINIFNLA